MIEEIELFNYRGFSKHKIPLRETSIIVGQNNAGKTTIIEAITLIAIVTSRASRSNFVSSPSWVSDPSAPKGVSPSLRGIEFEFRNLCYRYGTPPAIIKARLRGRRFVTIFIDSNYEDIFAVLRAGNKPITNKNQASIFAKDGELSG